MKTALEDPTVEFIARMDADDVANFQRIQVQVDFLNANPAIDICGSSVLVFSDSIKTTNSSKIISYPNLDSLIKFNMLFSCCLAHPTLMFRIKSVGSDLKYDEANPVSLSMEDYELWLRLIHDTKV